MKRKVQIMTPGKRLSGIMLIMLSILWGLSFPAPAQETETDSTIVDREELKDRESIIDSEDLIDISELSTRLPHANSELNNLKKNLISQKILHSKAAELDSFKLDIRKLEKEIMSADTGRKDTRMLEGRIYSWNSLKIKNMDYEEDLRDVLDKLNRKKEKMEEIRELWNKSQGSFGEEVPEDSKMLIHEFLVYVQSNIDTVNTRAQQVMSLLEDITAISIEIEDNILVLENQIEEIKSSVLSSRSGSIFALLSNRDSIDIVPIHTGANFMRNMEPVKGYLETNRLRYMILILVFFVLWGTLSYVKRYKDLHKEEDEKYKIVNKSLVLLQYPFVTSLFLILLLTRFQSPLAPPDMYKLIFVITIFPLMRLIPKIISPELLKYFWGIGSIFLLSNLSELLFYGYPIHNIILFGLSIVLMYGLIMFIIRKRGASMFHSHNIKAIMTGFVYLSIFILGVIIITSMMGYYVLEEFLVNAFIWTYFGIFLFLTANLILSGLIDIILHSHLIQSIKAISNNTPEISKWFRGLVNLATFIMWLYAISILFRIKQTVIDALSNTWEYDIIIGKLQFSFGDIFLFVFILWLSFKLSKILRLILEDDIMPKFRLERGVPEAVSMMSKYLIVIIGFFFAVAAAGMELDKFAFIFGALGVGIGFGLQDVVNNFISGLILLFDRTLHVGDTVAVGELSGVVKKIGIRASIIQTWDHSDVVVPNSRLVSNDVKNYTLTNNIRRLEINIGVAYGSDMQQVLDLLVNASMEYEKTLKYPEPFAIFTGFGDSSMDFTLFFYYPEFDGGLTAKSEVAVLVEQALTKGGINIPYPQVDVHMKTTHLPNEEKEKKEP